MDAGVEEKADAPSWRSARRDGDEEADELEADAPSWRWKRRDREEEAEAPSWRRTRQAVYEKADKSEADAPSWRQKRRAVDEKADESEADAPIWRWTRSSPHVIVIVHCLGGEFLAASTCHLVVKAVVPLAGRIGLTFHCKVLRLRMLNSWLRSTESGTPVMTYSSAVSLVSLIVSPSAAA